MSQLKVQTGQLEQAAERITAETHRLDNSFAEMNNIINGTNNYWLGEAGEAHRRAFYSKLGKREEVLRRLWEEIRDLQQMAGVYVQTENEIVEAEASLPGDVIV